MRESSSLSVDIKNLVKTIHKIPVQWGKDKFSAMDRRDLCNHRCASQFSEVAGIKKIWRHYRSNAAMLEEEKYMDDKKKMLVLIIFIKRTRNS